MVSKLNLRILKFGLFLDPKEFFKNRVLSFETSDSDFRDLIDDFFHMVKNIFQQKKIKISGLISKNIFFESTKKASRKNKKAHSQMLIFEDNYKSSQNSKIILRPHFEILLFNRVSICFLCTTKPSETHK